MCAASNINIKTSEKLSVIQKLPHTPQTTIFIGNFGNHTSVESRLTKQLILDNNNLLVSDSLS